MMKELVKKILCLVCVLAPTLGAMAQYMPERSAVRKGNRLFNRSDYAGSIERYEAALKSDSTSFEAMYDLGNAYYKSERYADAEQYLTRAVQRIANDPAYTDEDRADALYNLGNVQFRQQKLQEALDCYKGALLLRPSDPETKYNYFYTKQLLKQQENQDQNQNQDQDQNKDQNQDQQQNQDQKDQQNQQDHQDQNPNKDQNQDPDKDQNQDQQQNPDQQDPQRDPSDNEQSPEQEGQAPQISEQEQQQMLDAIQAQEDRTQEKLKEKRAIVIRGGKNW